MLVWGKNQFNQIQPHDFQPKFMTAIWISLGDVNQLTIPRPNVAQTFFQIILSNYKTSWHFISS